MLNREKFFEHQEPCWVLFLSPTGAPLTGNAGLVDWYTNGLISKWVIQEKITLTGGELVLMDPGPLLNAKQLLVVGVNPRSPNSEEILEKVHNTLIQLQEPACWMVVNESCPEDFVQDLQKTKLPALRKAAITVEVRAKA